MFGFLYFLLYGVDKVGKGIKGIYKEEVSKEEAKRDGRDTYTGSDGKTRFIDNGVWIHGDILSNGDRVLVGVEDHIIYKNYTEDENQKAREQAKQNSVPGQKAYLYMKSTKRIWRGHKKDDILYKGDLYQDLKSGQIYVQLYRNVDLKRKLGMISLYLDVETDTFVGKSDEQRMKYDIKHKKEWNEIPQKAKELVISRYKRGKISKDMVDSTIKNEIRKMRNNMRFGYVPDDEMDDYLQVLNSVHHHDMANDYEWVYDEYHL